MVDVLRRRADDFRAAGRPEDALLALEHLLHHDPANMDALRGYVSIAASIIEQAAEDDRNGQWESLEGFVRVIAVRGPSDSFDAVLDCVHGLRRAAATATRPTAEHAAPAHRLDATVADGGLDKLVRTTPREDLEPLLSELEELRASLAADAPREHAEAVERAIEDARFLAAFDGSLAEIERMLAAQERGASTPRQAYELQAIEGLVRPFAAEGRRLDPERLARIDAALGRLRKLGDEVGHRARAEEGLAAWRKFEAENAEVIAELRRWSDAHSWRLKAAEANGTFAGIIRKARGLALALQEIVPATLHTDSSAKVSALASGLNELLARAAAAQQAQYDRWALRQIKKGYEKGKEKLGVIDDEKGLGTEMIRFFGPIDTRLLGHEAQRCYSEVFDLLFNRLDKPDKPSDFHEEGNKLFVLQSMLETPKLGSGDF